MIKIGICGICGKMGQKIATLVERDKDVTIGSALEHPEHPMVGKNLKEAIGLDRTDIIVSSDVGELAKGADVIIDFTLPEPTMEHLKGCVDNGVPVVIGTTGIKEDGEKIIREAGQKIPVVFSPNMATGVNLVFNIVAKAARVLGEDFSIKVDETHHVHKVDSPSGTAKMIGRVIREACGKDVPIEAFREGEVVGNHGIVFDGEFENIEIRHDAKSRDVFALGAIKASKFVVNKDPGFYTMTDVLGLE